MLALSRRHLSLALIASWGMPCSPPPAVRYPSLLQPTWRRIHGLFPALVASLSQPSTATAIFVFRPQVEVTLIISLPSPLRPLEIDELLPPHELHLQCPALAAYEFLQALRQGDPCGAPHPARPVGGAQGRREDDPVATRGPRGQESQAKRNRSSDSHRRWTLQDLRCQRNHGCSDPPGRRLALCHSLPKQCFPSASWERLRQYLSWHRRYRP